MNAKPDRTLPTVEGTVVAVQEERVRYDGSYWKREVVIDIGHDGSEEPLPIVFELEDADLAAGLREGERVTVGYELHGRRWNGPKGTRYFATLVGRRLTRHDNTYEGWSF